MLTGIVGCFRGLQAIFWLKIVLLLKFQMLSKETLETNSFYRIQLQFHAIQCQNPMKLLATLTMLTQ